MSNEMTPEQKEEIKKAKGKTWKKVLWWVIGILGVVAVIVTVVLLLLPKKNGKNVVGRIIQKTKKEIDKADIEAKIEVAKAEGAAEEKIKELERVMEIEDDNERRARLAELL